LEKTSSYIPELLAENKRLKKENEELKEHLNFQRFKMAQNIYFLLCITMKHKTQDYKITAVKYYLQNDDNLDEVCSIFACKKTSLRRWIMKCKKDKHLERLNRPSMSYKITKEQVKYAIRLLKQNKQMTMTELRKLLIEKISII